MNRPGDQPISIGNGPTHRLEALADGVFAIVMTLLVFNISLPREHPIGDLSRALLDLWPNFLAYGISVGLVGIYWSAHHAMFGIIRRASHELNWFNLLFLACLAVLPFSTSLIASHHDETIALVFYGGNLVLIGLSLLLIWAHATFHRRLVADDLPAGVIRFGTSRIVVGIVAYGLGLVLAIASPPLSLVIYAAVPLLYIVPGIQRAWRRAFGV